MYIHYIYASRERERERERERDLRDYTLLVNLQLQVLYLGFLNVFGFAIWISVVFWVLDFRFR